MHDVLLALRHTYGRKCKKDIIKYAEERALKKGFTVLKEDGSVVAYKNPSNGTYYVANTGTVLDVSPSTIGNGWRILAYKTGAKK